MTAPITPLAVEHTFYCPFSSEIWARLLQVTPVITIQCFPLIINPRWKFGLQHEKLSRYYCVQVTSSRNLTLGIFIYFLKPSLTHLYLCFSKGMMHVLFCCFLCRILHPISSLHHLYEPCFYGAFAQIGSVCNRITLGVLASVLLPSLFKTEHICFIHCLNICSRMFSPILAVCCLFLSVFSFTFKLSASLLLHEE